MNDWTMWELENAKVLAAQAPYQFSELESWAQFKKEAEQSDNYLSGRGVDHYNRYQEDFQILKQLHMNAFRFGIEWSRVEPMEGAWDAAAIDHYRACLKELKELKITPVVTLFHFTLPTWFAARGGFEKRRNVKYFVRFVDKILDELGKDIEWIVTINEPTVYVGESYMIGERPPNKTKKLLGLRVLNNLIYAHKKIAKLPSRQNSHKLSMAHHVIELYAGDDAKLSQLSARIANYAVNHFAIRRVRKHSDFLALNYYMSQRIFGYRVHNSEINPTNDLGWDMQPGRLAVVLEDLAARYHLPIMITENGLADASDSQRQWWLTESIKAMHEALKHDVELIGYLHWSLLDNFEWEKGYWPRFGLVEVDRKTMKRRIRPSAKWFGAVVKKLRG